jgi:hypothetical protein
MNLSGIGPSGLTFPKFDLNAIWPAWERLAPQLVVPLAMTIAAFAVLTFCQRHFAGRIISLVRWRIAWYPLVAPGVLFHECSHAVMCLLTLTRITFFAPFWPHQQPDGGWELGHVDHIAVGPLRSTLIALGPLLLVPPALAACTLVLIGSIDPAHLQSALSAAGPLRAAAWLALVVLGGSAAAPSAKDPFSPPALIVLVTMGVIAAGIFTAFAGEAAVVGVATAIATIFGLCAAVVGPFYLLSREV